MESGDRAWFIGIRTGLVRPIHGVITAVNAIPGYTTMRGDGGCYHTLPHRWFHPEKGLTC
jgi:hypothetical protein